MYDFILFWANCHIFANINDKTHTPWIGNLDEDDFREFSDRVHS